ncbi:OmpA family protein [Serinicoccus kebangsaanensis]|uniref:OmpA family protein n=1 Tax=Serinicoccus kebangsaanensis TaxID=2602069 RepID=UPI00124D960B|nr:OmpA family protein [Serinicoccus kebangsaanensis]
MNRPLQVVAVMACLAGVGLPTAAAVDAPVPEDYVPPRSSAEVYSAWDAPLTSTTFFYSDPEQVEPEVLEEAVGAEQDGEETVATLSDRFLFDFGSAQLRPTAEQSLDTLAALLQETEGEITVIGHTDSLGTDEINGPLSEERAQAVADYLSTAGVEAGRLETQGLGSTEPVADNTRPDGSDNPAGRQQNRRVEVRYDGG